jgi:RimJ/RimL family protein N-acetyltransferase
MNLQPSLENDIIKLVPISENDFDELFQVAADAAIWEQHPIKDRYKREVFQNFFNSAIASKGAFLVYDKIENKLIGSSRYYEYQPENKSIVIGFTFIAKEYWGKNYNRNLKALMLNYAFEFVDEVIFHIGANNIRSQKAIENIGGVKFFEEELAYPGETVSAKNFFYKISKKAFFSNEI